MRFRKSFELLIISLSQPLLWLAIVLVATLPLFFLRLGSLLPGVSAPEKVAVTVASQLSSVTHNPFYAPHQLSQFVLQHGPGALTYKMRFVSAAFAFIFALLFYYIVRIWHTRRVAILTSLLLVSSSWFLHYARMATPDVLFMGLVVGLAYGTWLETTKKRQLPLVIGAFVVAFLLYIPGFVWFVLGALIWQKRRIKQRVRNAPTVSLISGALFLGLLAPLVYALVNDPTLVKQFAGWNTTSSFINAAKTLARIPYFLVARGPSDPAVWIPRLPLLDAFTLVMAGIGAFSYFYRAKLDRTRVLASSLLVSAGLAIIGGIDKIIVLLPIIYLLAAAGISFMLQRWFTVFPKNPLARSIGVALIIFAVLCSVFYQLNQYFVAWPARPATKAVYSQQL